MPLRTTIDSSDRHSAAAPRIDVAASSVRSRARSGLARECGSQTARCTRTCGSNLVTTSTMRSWSPGTMRWKTVRRSRRRGGSPSIPSSDSTHGSFSSRLATRRADLTAHPADEHPLPNIRHESRRYPAPPLVGPTFRGIVRTFPVRSGCGGRRLVTARARATRPRRPAGRGGVRSSPTAPGSDRPPNGSSRPAVGSVSRWIRCRGASSATTSAP